MKENERLYAAVKRELTFIGLFQQEPSTQAWTQAFSTVEAQIGLLQQELSTQAWTQAFSSGEGGPFTVDAESAVSKALYLGV